MSSDEYRKRAHECVDLAQTAREPDRRILLEIAQAWLALADGEAALVPADPAAGPPASLQRH